MKSFVQPTRSDGSKFENEAPFLSLTPFVTNRNGCDCIFRMTEIHFTGILRCRTTSLTTLFLTEQRCVANLSKMSCSLTDIRPIFFARDAINVLEVQ